MQIQIETRTWTEIEADWLIVPLAEAQELTGPLQTLNEALGGQLTRLRESNDLTGKLAELLPIRDVPGIAASRLLLVGLGKADELNLAKLDKALMTAARSVSDKRDLHVAVALPTAGPLDSAACAQATATAMQVGSLGQDLYRAEPGRFPFATVTILSDSNTADLGEAVERGRILGEAVNLTRELVNRPAMDIFPVSFAQRAEQVARDCGLHCEIFDEQRLRDEKMGALLAVAVGSAQPPRVVVLEHRGGGPNAPTLALCGKGVTFDSGGLSLKPSDGMATMKCDMAGAATVLGAMSAIARLNLPVNVTGYMGLVENMPSGTAFKLGDVLTARNGVTIEVLNTDAEGRLVLADVLSYAVDRGAERLIDLATLTGACVVALGEDVTGAFSNNQDWCDQVLAAAKEAGEDLWQLPMFDLYGDLIKSDVADIKNTGGRWGGAISAAKFLEKFVGDKPWVHLDIAGPSFASSNKPHREGGGTGCMLRTLVQVASVGS
jgi:leucyl aminopeptidase